MSNLEFLKDFEEVVSADNAIFSYEGALIGLEAILNAPARHLFRLDRLDDDAMDAILAAEFFEPLKHGSHAALPLVRKTNTGYRHLDIRQNQ